jgi:RNA polymerase sigma-70 factor (ECF subfamily)
MRRIGSHWLIRIRFWAAQMTNGDVTRLLEAALVNGAYLRLAPAAASCEDRRHFFGAAAEAMRRILVDHARRRLASKRGADFQRVTLTGPAPEVAAPQTCLDVLQLDDALTKLRAESPRLADLVNLRFVAGLSIEDAARVPQVSTATAKRDWSFAKAWLHQRFTGVEAV